MTFSATVLYPNNSDSTFDMDYYLKTHMPLVESTWKEYGLKSWNVVQFQQGPDGSKPYSVQAILNWDSAQSMQTASEKEGGKVFGDIPNFSNTQPVLVMGDVVATS